MVGPCLVGPCLVGQRLGRVSVAIAGGELRLPRLVVGLLVAGAASSAFVVVMDGGRPAVETGWPPWLLVALMLGLAAMAERAYVRVRHGESTEDLTFFEAVLVTAALLLPVAWALGALVAGLAAACAMVRRPLVKSAFNVGSYSLGIAAFAAVSRLVAGEAAAFSLLGVVGVLLGTLAFATVNLLALAAVLAVVEGVPARAVVNDEWQLSAVMAAGNAGVGLLAVHLAHSAPALLPFVALPLLAIGYSYRAAAQHAGERERNRWLVTFSGALAGDAGPDRLLLAAEAIRGVFGADRVRLVLADDCVVADAAGGGTVDRDQHDQAMVAELGSQTNPVLMPLRAGAADRAAPGPAHAEVVAPLDLAGGRRGALVLGWEHQPGRRWSRSGAEQVDLAMLAAVAAAVAGACRAAERLAALVAESSKLQAVVDHSTDGVAVVAADGRVLVWSPAMRQLTGRAITALEPRPGTGDLDPVAALLVGLAAPGADAVALARDLNPQRPRSAVLLEVDVGAERHHLEVTVTRIDPGGGAGADGASGRLAVLTAHDVTEARRLERLKGDFIATVSHELRTPMTPIKGYAQLLATRGDRMTPARRLQALELIQERAEHMGRLVDDLLLASTVGTEGAAKLKIEPEDVDLRAVLHRAVAAFPTLSSRVSTSSPAVKVPVHCDAVRTVQCLTNLLGNAEKYATPGTPIDVELVVDDGWAAVTVADRGPGIPASETERVFERFHRLDDALTMQSGGSGLGLYIARELARAMGGDLTLASVLDQGSTFTFRLPLRVTPPDPAAVPAPRIALEVSS